MQKSNIEKFKEILTGLYAIICLLTFLFVTFGRGYPSNWTEHFIWFVSTPIHCLYASLWPLYWLVFFLL